MASYTLLRTDAYKYDPDDGDGSVGANGEFRVNGRQHGRFTFDLSGLRTALGDRLIRVTGLQFSWYTSARFTYNIYFNTSSDDDGNFAGEASGSSSTLMQWTGFECYTPEHLTALETKVNETSENDVYFTMYKKGSPSGNGYCQWGSITVYYELGAPIRTTIIDSITIDEAIAVGGSDISYAVQLYNTQQTPMTNARAELFCEVSGEEVPVADTQDFAVSIPSAGIGTFRTTSRIYDGLSLARGSQIKIRITLSGTETATQTTDFIKMIDRYYSPSIKRFALYRCSDVSGTMQRDDFGIEIMSNIQIGLDVDSGASIGDFVLYAYYQENGNVDTTVSSHIDLNLAANFDELIVGVSNDTTLIRRDDNFSNHSTWFFKLVLTDGYETAVFEYSVAKAFANVHLAGLATGGVRFGGFCSRSTPNNPAFECDYPIYADGGIVDLDYSTSETKAPYRWIDNKPIYRRTVRVENPVLSNNECVLAMISDCDTVMMAKGLFRSEYGGSNVTWLLIPYYESSNYASLLIENGVVKYYQSTDFKPVEIIATIEYTKTED